MCLLLIFYYRYLLYTVSSFISSTCNSR